MKRLLSAALALSLLSGTAVYAEPYDHRGGHHDRGDFDRGRHDSWRHRDRDDGAGTAIAVGVGLLALTAIIAASQDRDSEVRYDRNEGYQYEGPPPEDAPEGAPPPPSYDESQDE